MDKKEYLKQLSDHLNKLPKSDYDDVMDHFEEYFDEAGPEGEKELIKDLGSPREVATEILTKLLSGEDIDESDRVKADDNRKTPYKEKSFLRYLTIAVLIILAAPIGLPLTVALIAIIFAMFAVIISLVFALGATAFAIGLVFIKLFFIGIITLFTSPAAAMILLGTSLIALFATLILVIIIVSFYKLFIVGIKKVVSFASGKRGEK